MPAVFVHGVPDTRTLWDPVCSRLQRADIHVLSLPGFGAAVPPGFECTKEAYVSWLLEQLEQIPGELDLVGHGWGTVFVLRAASLQPGRVRTWIGGGGAIDPDYDWHETAKLWQTPEVGEAIMDSLTGDAITAELVSLGMPKAAAPAVAAQVDRRMKTCILTLYRSALELGDEWTQDLLAIDRPGMILTGADDQLCPSRFSERMADRMGARYVAIADCGHWWPLDQPDVVVELLEAHWTR